MTKKQRALLAIERLEAIYPVAKCSLTSSSPHELLIATRLSAQCTDARVNIVTKELFQKYRSVSDFAEADVADIERIIRPCGLYKTKARDIVSACQKLMLSYGGTVPDTMEALTSLPGVGRKTANLVLGDIYGKPAVVADTHCIRICGRLGLTDGTKDAFRVETQLRKILPPEKSNDFCHRLVLFGRDTCSARNPKCNICPLADLCKKII